MNLLEIILLSFVEGITEFLPVSSTAHLIFVQNILGKPVDASFTVIIQLGAILAAAFYFRKDIVEITRDFILKLKERNVMQAEGTWILLSLIPVIVVGFFLKDYLNQIYNVPILLAFNTVFFGLLFFIVEKFRSNSANEGKDLTLKNYLLIGLAQIFAILPGVSRSGSTITGGIAQGIDFKRSIRISFLMSIPAMFLASGYELLGEFGNVKSQGLVNILVGLIFSFIFGLISVKLTLGVLQKYGFKPFTIYRIVFGILIILTLVK